MRFGFHTPTLYQIKVFGQLDPKVSDRLSGMQLTVEKEDVGLISVLVGQVRDQADLAGILNTLYEMHIVLLSVNMLLRSND